MTSEKMYVYFNELLHFLIWIYFTEFFDPADCTVVHYVANCLCYIDIDIFYIYIILSVCMCAIGRIKAFSLNLANVRCSMLTFMTLIDMKSSIHEIHWQFEDARKANVQCNKNSSMSVSWVLVWKLGRGAGVASCVHSSTVLQLYYRVIVSYIPSLHKWVRKPCELRPTRRISTHHNELRIHRRQRHRGRRGHVPGNVWSAGDEVPYIPGKICQVSAVAC